MFSANSPVFSANPSQRDYVKICKPAFFSNSIPENNLLFSLLLDGSSDSSNHSTERAEEYGERFWRLAGERHTLICYDIGDRLILERVEECHHDDSILDELYAAASILSEAGLKRKQEFFERIGGEKVREFIAKHSDYFIEIFESEDDEVMGVATTIINSPAPVLCQLLHVLTDAEDGEKCEAAARVVSALGGERLVAVLGSDFTLRRRLLPYLI
ncbi:hypothetical protein Ferp_0535 [Ferroglobus placidus DSM 10642]|uniref:Uncharacterized protein n=1 Tax=Ferroglobus placidus (strain DSM 10642 / AEDII12DO) TaxID=589924 RepID=D3S376_FERPA|nr:hypothetical protein [Ferroglobus placidus]ADC64709.1 hypothetical protein Ferp_0535 [Ferroglobus placidus DSM 10642]